MVCSEKGHLETDRHSLRWGPDEIDLDLIRNVALCLAKDIVLGLAKNAGLDILGSSKPIAGRSDLSSLAIKASEKNN